MGVNIEANVYFTYLQMAWPEFLHPGEILSASHERICSDAILC